MKNNGSEDDSVFERNIERYALYDPVVTLALENTDCQGYEECYTHLGELNLSRTVDKSVFYYHEMDGARAESKMWFKNLPAKEFNCIILYGIGLGYYYDPIKSWLRTNPDNMFIVIEDELPVMKKFFETQRASEFLDDPQVLLHYFDSTGPTPMRSFFDRFREILTGFGREGVFLTSSSLYYRIKEMICIGMRNEIFSFTTWLSVIMNEIIVDRQTVFENFYSNTLRQYGAYDVHQLKDCFKNVPAVICGAGPSIVKDIDTIRSIQNDAIIIASGTGMNVLNHYGILPHFGTGLDPTRSQGTRIRTNFAYEVPVFYSTRFHGDSFRLIQAYKLFVKRYGGYLISQWVDQELGLEGDSFFGSGVSSTNFAMDFACLLGCNPIILSGFDLAYTDASRYPAIISEHPIDPKSSKVEITSKSENPILGGNSKGERVLTKIDWIEEASVVQAFIKAHPETKVINTSLEGLSFRYIEYADFKDLKKSYFNRSWDLKNWIHAEIQNVVLPIHKEKYLETIVRWKESLHRCRVIYQEIKSILEGLWTQCQEGYKLPTAPYSGRIALLESDLWEEPAYKYLVLDVFVAFDNMSIPSKIFFKRFQTELTDIERDLKKLEMGLNYTAFFEDLLGFQEALLTRVIEEYVEEEKALSRRAEDAPVPQQIHFDTDVYAMENGRIIIKDSSLDLNIDIAFSPQLLPKGAKKPFKEGEVVSDLFLTSNGKLEGEYQKYYDEDRLFAEMYYHKEKLHGPVTFYHKNGAVLAKSWFVYGVQQGKNWQYYPSGQLSSLQGYKDGLAEGEQTYFYEDGTLKSHLHFSKGLYHGQVLLYYSNGQIKRELHFKEGKLHGLERHWAPSGILLWEVHYEEGKPVGEAKLWHSNGQLARSYVYFEDHKRYNLKEWGNDGQLIYEEDNITEDLQETQRKKMVDLMNAIVDFNKDLDKLQKMTKYEKRQLFY